jgi:N-methylhydantoinase A/oxoprolinase/acetone carboxylase beta subunit
MPDTSSNGPAGPSDDWRFVFDIGGTFTDVVIADAAGQVSVDKCLTRPADITAAVVEGFRRLTTRGGVTPAAVHEVVSGATTVVTNMIIERKGAPTGLIATAGFADIIEIGRELRYDVYDLSAHFPEPLVPRDLRQEVAERVDADGAVAIPLDEAATSRALVDLAAAGATSVAVVFLHSFKNPDHERRVREIAAEVTPDLFISLSSDVLPEVREYERTVATVLNAYVRPNIGRYLSAIEDALRGTGIDASLRIMQSNGGVISRDYAEQQPLRMLESGPAAGALAAAHVAASVGLTDILSFDMGGTTAKACMVADGEPDITTEFETARVHRFKRGSGLPVRLPAMDMIEIGAGGGSIARVDQTGLLKVGPVSAGADPGPACYDRGGTLPTVTDAAVVLGFLDPAATLGGDVNIRRDLAEEAILRHVAEPLGLGIVESASGIHRIVCENMASAAKVHAIEKGKDVRNSAIVAFGGAGPMHAREVARRMGSRRIVVPPDAGVLSAIGLLVAPAKVDAVQSRYARIGAVDWPAVGGAFEAMRGSVRDVLAAAGAGPSAAADDDAITYAYAADMRYVGQGFEVRVPLGAAADLTDEALADAFRATYAGKYGHHLDDVDVEALSWRVVGTAPVPWADVISFSDTADEAAISTPTRPVHFADAGGYVETPVFAHGALPRPSEGVGPAIIEQTSCVVVIGPGDSYAIDGRGNITITLAAAL